MNRINQLFQQKKDNILSLYFTAGHPQLNSTSMIIEQLQTSGADMIEIGMPFSDPLADGPVIQDSSSKALMMGMSIHLLFEQLKDIRSKVSIPLLLMGYLNPVMQYGMKEFCSKCRETGIDGLIIPDLPMDEYSIGFKEYVEANDLRFIFLITPQTSPERIRLIDSLSNGFIYMVSSASTTGAKSSIAGEQIEYFTRVRSMNLKNPLVIGFGISNRETFSRACNYANGAIIGSAFVKMLNDTDNLREGIDKFVSSVK